MAKPYFSTRDRIRKLLLPGLLFPILISAIFVGFLFAQIERMRQASAWLNHTDQVLQGANELQRLLVDCESGYRGFLLTGREEFLRPYVEAKRQLPQSFAKLTTLVGDNPPQLAKISHVQKLFEKWEPLARVPLEMKEAGEDYIGFISTGQARAVADQMREVIREFIDVEQTLRDQRSRATERADFATRLIAVFFSVVIVLILGASIQRQITKVSGIYEEELEKRMLAEQQLRALNEELELRVQERTVELEATNSELEAFTYSVSHDLRAPLRSINGFSRILSDKYQTNIDERGRDFLSRIMRASEKMGRLIDELLTLSRITRSHLRKESLDLSRLVRSITQDLQATSPTRDVELDVQEGLRAQADSGLIRVALENLLGNAWKFTSKRSKARIIFGRDEQKPGRPFFIRDNGAGFDMKYVGAVFKPFERLHLDQEFEGSGIGLATVSRIVDRHGGRVWAEGKVDEGATFYFTLPEVKEATEGDDLNAKTTDLVSGRQSGRRSPHLDGP